MILSGLHSVVRFDLLFALCFLCFCRNCDKKWLESIKKPVSTETFERGSRKSNNVIYLFWSYSKMIFSLRNHPVTQNGTFWWKVLPWRPLVADVYKHNGIPWFLEPKLLKRCWRGTLLVFCQKCEFWSRITNSRISSISIKMHFCVFGASDLQVPHVRFGVQGTFPQTPP